MFKLYRIKHANPVSYIKNLKRPYLALGLTIFVILALFIFPAISFAVLGEEAAPEADNIESNANVTNTNESNADPDYLCIENKGTSSQSFQFKWDGKAQGRSFEMSTDLATWYEVSLNTNIYVDPNGKCYLRGENPQGINSPGAYDEPNIEYWLNINSEDFFISGDIMTLIGYNPTPNEIPNNCCFGYFFQYLNADCSQLKLSATTLKNSCYFCMFQYSYITVAPKLNASQLCKDCYTGMFDYCSKLEQPPELPAENLAENCYYGMFEGSGITSAPVLNANQLSPHCYHCMFMRCEQLTQAPVLNSTNLAEGCYYKMFVGCVGLSTPPELPSLNLANDCYCHMFSGSGITATPKLQAEKLYPSCYDGMFWGCRNLTYAGELPSIELAENCYFDMFHDCRNLIEAPKLPATNLKKLCYKGMFENCRSLTKAPDLPATVVSNSSSYEGMFNGCSKLISIRVAFTSWPEFEPENATKGFSNWLNGVSSESSCTFICPSQLEEVRGINAIPENWQIVREDISATITTYDGPYDGDGHGLSITNVFPDNTTFKFSEDSQNWQDELEYTEAGVYTIYYKLECPGHYTVLGSKDVVINKVSGASASFTTTFSKTYGEDDPNFGEKIQFTNFLSGEEPVEDEDYIIKREVGEDANAGNDTYAVNIYFLNNADRNYECTVSPGSLTINKASATIIANDCSKLEGESDPDKFTVRAEGLNGSKDSLVEADYQVARQTGQTVGTFSLTPSLTATGQTKLLGNYNVSFEPGSLTIYGATGDRISSTSNSFYGYYDGQNHGIAVNVTSPATYKIEYRTVDIDWREPAIEFSKAGEYPVDYRITADGCVTVQGSEVVSIKEAPVTIAANCAYKSAGQADPAFGATITGLADGEQLTPGVDYSITCDHSEDPGVYDINVSLINNSEKTDNYNISFIPSKFFVLGEGGVVPGGDPTYINGSNVAQTGDSPLIAIIVAMLLVLVAGALLYFAPIKKYKNRKH